ncbi:MAG: hypothetical protein CMM25_02860 [Rhodospirillaceae bacterium]|nr:hypothetical protein [Rhodospirillaceae bacterium]
MTELVDIVGYNRKFNTRPRLSYLVIDNFLSNPMDTRNYVLEQEFSVSGNFPGRRTRPFSSSGIRDLIQKVIEPLTGKIIRFPMDNEEGKKNYNGAFQYTTSRDRTWIHCDTGNNWAGVLYLTPDAPLSSGTGIFRHKDTGIKREVEAKIKGVNDEINERSQDYTAWEQVDVIGNVFNRLVLFDSSQYHASLDYFGTTPQNGRLFQTFFFTTER